MKQVLIPAAFNPAARAVDFSNVAGFNPTLLLAIINASAREIIFDPTTNGLGLASASGAIITLQANLSTQTASDRIIAFYDDGQSPATAAAQPLLSVDGGALNHITNFPATQTIAGVVTANDGGAPISGATMPSGGSGVTGWLSAIRTGLAGTLSVSGSINVASLPSLPVGANEIGSVAVSNFPNTQTVSWSGQTVTSNDGGAAVSGATIPSGGSGVTGWLSAIWQKLAGTLTVSGLVNVASLPSLPAGSNSIGAVTQSGGPWSVAWSSQSVAATQSGAWSVAIGNTPTVNLGALNGTATDASLQAVKTALGSPFQAGASIANTVFGATQSGGWTVSVANFPSAQNVSDLQSAPYAGAVAMTAGASYAAQRSLGVLCSVAGAVQMQFTDSSTLILPVGVGWQTFPFAVTQIVAAGTTATATYFNLK